MSIAFIPPEHRTPFRTNAFPSGTRLPANIRILDAELCPNGVVSINGNQIEDDHVETVIGKATYSYQQSEQMLSLESESANYPSANFCYDETSCSWWGFRANETDENTSAYFLTEWLSWYDIEYSWTTNQIDAVNSDGIPTTPAHDLGVLKLLRDGSVVADGTVSFPPGKAIETTQIDAVQIRRGSDSGFDFWQKHSVLEILNLVTGKNYFFVYIDNVWCECALSFEPEPMFSKATVMFACFWSPLTLIALAQDGFSYIWIYFLFYVCILMHICPVIGKALYVALVAWLVLH